MGIFGNLSIFNPFGDRFAKNQTFEKEIEKQLEDNSVGISDTEFDLARLGMDTPSVGTGYGDVLQRFVNFNQIFESKSERVAKYRTMAYYPEISEALDIVSDESIVADSEGKIVHLNITKEIPSRIYRMFLKDFEYVANDVFKVRDNLYGLFYKWLVEGELFVELIVDKETKKGLIGYKTLPSFSTFPIYNKVGRLVAFAQSSLDVTGKPELIPFVGNQISYINWGKYGKDLLDVRGYLEESVRTYNQLKNLEDSLIIYRLVRAPERRVWNIEVGRMPTQKADQFIRRMIQKYKKQLTYNPTTGNIDSSRNIQSLSEDYWFSQRDGQGTSVETIGGGMQLGELDDVRYFLTKMYKTLKLPKNRWDPNISQSQYQSGKDIDREELKFTLFVERIQNRFKKLILDAFTQHIKFKYGTDEKIKPYLKVSLFDVNFTPANFFKEMKDLELLETRLAILGTAISYASSPSDPHQPFSREFILRRYFKMTDEEYEENKRLLEVEREKNKKINKEEMESGEQEGNGESGDSTGETSNTEKETDDETDTEKIDKIISDIDKEEETEENESVYTDPKDIHINKNVKDFLQRKTTKKKKVI
jgi:hypothetical protein